MGITLGSLPTGLVLNGVTGVISGTPSASGTSNFTVQVTDANGAVSSQALSITIYTAVSVTTTALSDGTVSAFLQPDVVGIRWQDAVWLVRS